MPLMILFQALCTTAMLASAVAAREPQMQYVKDRAGQIPQPIVAVEDVCAWPNLTQLPDGTIIALIYNQPSHGRMPGDVECWASVDGGLSWSKRSVAAPREEPQQNRMNVAAGLTAEGHLILVTSGWSHPGDGNAPGLENFGHVLRTWVCISRDGGQTWSIDKQSFPKAPDGRELIPFGDIMPGEDGQLRVAAYRGGRGPADSDVPPPAQEDEAIVQLAAYGQNWIVRGDGKSWDPPTPMGARPLSEKFNETALLHLGEGRWLAAARFDSGSTFIHHSFDDGKTWSQKTRIKGLPAHLLRLEDGTIVLSYGKRGGNQPGVEVMFSDDDGRTWSDAYRVHDVAQGHGDLGYPSSVQRDDGLVVTAYYEGNSTNGDYHMGVVVWDPSQTRQTRPEAQATNAP
jgi:hypothetical protein